jgi:hypothetical protein
MPLDEKQGIKRGVGIYSKMAQIKSLFIIMT